MTTELRIRNQSQQLYNRALSQAWRNNIQIWDPSIWQNRDPDVEEKMLRDADIAHAVGYRRHMIAGKDWQMQPKNENAPNAKLAVHVATKLVDRIQHFTTARLNLSRAFFSGARFGKIHGKHVMLDLGDGKERMWWVPVRIEDIDKRRYRIVPKWDSTTGEIQAHWELWNVAKADWVPETQLEAITTIRHVYQDDEATLGHGRALREALGWWWYAKTHVFQESLMAVERFAQGIIHAKIDGVRDAATGKPNEDLIADWQAILEDMRSRHVLVSDKEDSVEMVKMDGQGWQLLHEIREELRSTIFTLVLGANLTTSASEGGSYALAEIQENSTEALIQFDRETLEDTLTNDLMQCLWFKNHANLHELGIVSEMPSFGITQEKRNDPKEVAEVAQMMAGIGLPIALADMYDRTGIKEPEEGEPLLEVPQPADPMGASPFGSLLGDPATPPPPPGANPPPPGPPPGQAAATPPGAGPAKPVQMAARPAETGTVPEIEERRRLAANVLTAAGVPGSAAPAMIAMLTDPEVDALLMGAGEDAAKPKPTINAERNDDGTFA